MSTAGRGLPGLVGTEHIGFTVPDIEIATRFFVDVIGCEHVYSLGPFADDGYWMGRQLNVHPRTVMTELRFLRCATGPNFEISSTKHLISRLGVRATATSAVITLPSTSRTCQRQSTTSAPTTSACLEIR